MYVVSINGNFFHKQVTGVQRFAREITSALDKLEIPNDISIELVVPDKSKVDIDYGVIKVVEYTGVGEGLKWDFISFPKYVKKHSDCALNLGNHPTLSKTPSMLVLHDVTYRANFNFHNKGIGLVKTVWNCLLYSLGAKYTDKLLTVSCFSENEIKKYYKCTKNQKIGIIHNAWQHMDSIIEDDTVFKENKEFIRGEYYFAISSLAKNKNLKWILSAANNMPNSFFVVAGNVDVELLKSKIDLPNNVVFMGFVEDGQAKSLMKNCKAFLFPTLYEGFGIPPLEAIACGAPSIVISDIEVMHEIYGDEAIYINPLDYENAIIEYKKKDPSLVLQNYSWTQSAIKLLEHIVTMKG